jgi:hypothetical protein
VAVVAIRSIKQPSHDREWQEPLKILPEPVVEGDRLTIRGLRNFRWGDEGSHEARWETRSYRLSRLESVDLIVEPFEYSSLMAHTMMSFDFGEDGRFIISIEARKEVGEEYNPITGGLNQFEFMYLFLDERDALTVRAQKGHELYLYPLRADSLKLRAFLLNMCASASNLRRKPEFYHIIRHNCTTAWIDHADAVTSDPVGLRLESVVNGLIARYLFEKGAVVSDLSFAETRSICRIDQRVREAPGDSGFSEFIRAGMGRLSEP